MTKPIPLQSQQLKMDFSIDLTLFCQNIKDNFTLIWQTLTKQADQIQSLKLQQQSKQQQRVAKSRVNSRNSNRKISKNFSLNLSQLSQQQGQVTPPQIKINPENSFTPILDKKQNNDHLGDKISEEKEIKDNAIVDHVEGAQKNAEEQIEAKESKVGDNQMSSMIENKIYQMSERLQRVELAAIKQSGTFSKKMNQINNELERVYENINKRDGQLKRQQLLIEKLRNELSQFKLKKEAQLMRMSNSNSGSSGNSNKQYNEFLLDKIQQISNCLPQLLLKSDFDDFRTELKPVLNKLQKKINQSVSSEEFNGLIGILSRKKGGDHIVSGKINRQPSKPTDKKLKDIQVDDIDPAFELRLISLQKELKQTKQKLDETKTINQQKTERISSVLSEALSRMEVLHTSQNINMNKSIQHEQFMKDMNDSYQQKFKEIIGQIAETQQSVEKLNNQMKFYSHTRTEGNIGPVGATSHSSGPIETSKIIDIQNDVGLLKKKVNKIALKMQGLKEELLGTRQDFTRQCDSIKAVLEKKCDWESLKKGMNYFEQRIKQVANYIESIQKGLNEPDENGESTAAKRGWTCLCCDKDIKQYQGKLGQAKFTSIFPSRYESPRIGGYYKQKQTNKEYAQVFLKHNRRLSQSNTKSKDQLI